MANSFILKLLFFKFGIPWENTTVFSVYDYFMATIVVKVTVRPWQTCISSCFYPEVKFYFDGGLMFIQMDLIFESFIFKNFLS